MRSSGYRPKYGDSLRRDRDAMVAQKISRIRHPVDLLEVLDSVKT
jgi:hypothetical protein